MARVSVRAVIVRESEVLLIHRVRGEEEYWVFPGGGVEEGDRTHEEALMRECKEELGVEVRVGTLFTSLKISVASQSRQEFFFACEIVGGELGTGTGPEYQTASTSRGVYSLEWVELNRLGLMDVRPEGVKMQLLQE